MTREEAISFLQNRIDLINKYHLQVEDYRESLDIAIKALAKEPCEDCVSRQAVIDLVNAECVDLQDGSELWRSCVNDTVESIYLKVKDMPPVALTQRWIPVSERLPKDSGEYKEYERSDKE